MAENEQQTEQVELATETLNKRRNKLKHRISELEYRLEKQRESLIMLHEQITNLQRSL